MDLRFCHPTTGLLVGGTGAGKTYFMKRLIENRHLMFNVQFDRIVWHFTEWQSIYADLKQKCEVEFYEGVPTLDEFPSDHGPLLLCLFPKGLRQISLNCSVCVIFKTSRDLAQIRSFCMQVNPSDWRALLEAYQDATVAPHSYLLFDFSYKQSDHMRLRACIFPGENTVVYIPKKHYKSGVTRELPLVADRHGHE
ncbi:Protein Ycf2 [Frankliniella fusca]|uniref:Protein Ycf2 n=1 Tax=Frankliniella fusca TaxID=407009 RepID=A0AAE1L6Y5_9NEOP|nr:Protein Ycf2 [Frankliniella fusca]